MMNEALSTDGKTVPQQGTLHTPGPWRASQRPHTKGPPSTDPADAHLDYFHIAAGGHLNGGWETCGYMRPADARLIVAAPEMFALLTQMEDWLRPEVTKEPDRTFFWKIVALRRKAMGQQPLFGASSHG